MSYLQNLGLDKLRKKMYTIGVYVYIKSKFYIEDKCCKKKRIRKKMSLPPSFTKVKNN